MEGADCIKLNIIVAQNLCQGDEKMLLEDFFAGFDVYPHLQLP